MDGFDPEAADEILDLKSKNLRSVIILPIGYRASEGDCEPKKVRRGRSNFVSEVK